MQQVQTLSFLNNLRQTNKIFKNKTTDLLLPMVPPKTNKKSEPKPTQNLPMSLTTVPDEIVLYHILPWLPSKSLVRFTSVCKSWNSFIRNPSFLHLRKLTNHFIFFSPDPQVGLSEPQVFSAPLYCDSLHPIITTPPRASLLFTIPNLNFSETRVQCVNGLLCFHSKRNVWFPSHVNAFTLIANPTTRQVVTLPIDETIDKKFMVSTHFGYDPVQDEFKVLRLFNYDGSHELKVFTLGSDTSWRVIVSEEPLHGLLSGHYYNWRGLCVNGAIYWSYSSNFLIIFNVGTEQLRMMPAPSGEGNFNLVQILPLQHQYLVEIDGCLCLFKFKGSDELTLWILRDNEAQVWEQKSVVIPFGVISQKQYIFPFCRVSTGEILLVPYFLSRYVRGIYYDMDTMISRSDVLLEMPLTWTQRFGEVDFVFCQESFRLLKWET